MGDLKLSVRSLRNNLGFTLIAVLTLALGVGANTAIFSVVKAVLLDRLPYPEPDRLVTLAEADPDNSLPITVGFTTVYDWRRLSRSFLHMSLYRDYSVAIVENGQPEFLSGLRVNYDFFDTLGVPMQLGRAFRPEEDTDKRRYVLILTDELWKRRFGGDRAVIGRVVRLNESSFTIVGVLPAGFRLELPRQIAQPEMYAPLGYELGQPNACRDCQHLRAIGRLKPGVAPGAARAELNTIMSGMVREFPDSYPAAAKVALEPLKAAMVGGVSDGLWVLLGAVGLVLLMACGNVANLLLARATGRGKEMALRAALGAGRGRLVGQLLAESLLLAFAGGLAGLLLAVWGTPAIARFAGQQIPRADLIAVDGPVLLFALLATLLTGILFGLAPAWRASRVDLNTALKDLGRTTEGPAPHTLRNALATAEFALAFVLVLGAGLMTRSFVRLMNVDPGFDPNHVLTLSTYVYGERYQKPPVELNYYRLVSQRLQALPGVEGVAMSSVLPLGSFDRRGFHMRERKLANESEAPAADTYSVSPDYFRVMKIPLLRGRGFGPEDKPDGSRVALISESCARRQYPGQDPIGHYIQLGGRSEKRPWIAIVGVVGDVRQYGLDRTSEMAAYILQDQDVSFGYSMIIRTAGDPGAFERGVRDAFHAVDPTLPIFQVQPMTDLVAASVATRSFTLGLLGAFGLLALVLAAVGIYGVVSCSVAARTREVGIRMALGAERRDVLRMVLAQGMKPIVIGVAAGFAASLGLTRFLASLLFEVKPGDLTTAATVALLLASVALAACYIPARRAARSDPMNTLRSL